MSTFFPPKFVLNSYLHTCGFFNVCSYERELWMMSNLPHPITGLPCSIHFSKYSEGGCLNTQFWPEWSKPTKIRNKMCACYGAVELYYYSSYEWICYTDLIVRFVAVVRIWLFEQQIWWFFDFLALCFMIKLVNSSSLSQKFLSSCESIQFDIHLI